jgi:hypothetical protein
MIGTLSPYCITNDPQATGYAEPGTATVGGEDRVTTLTGTVSPWSEHRAAAANAYEGGAYQLESELKVKQERPSDCEQGSGLPRLD